MIKVTSFEELAAEFKRQADGSSSVTITETRSISLQTGGTGFTDITSIMPCSYPNPEQVLMALEERLGRVWDTNLNIQETREEFIARVIEESYA